MVQLRLQGGVIPHMINGLAQSHGHETSFLGEGFNSDASERLSLVMAGLESQLSRFGLRNEARFYKGRVCTDTEREAG